MHRIKTRDTAYPTCSHKGHLAVDVAFEVAAEVVDPAETVDAVPQVDLLAMVDLACG
jgi:hypothetical protein